MPKSSPIQTSFVGGEFSPLLKGGVELERYKQALETCVNFIPTLQGGLMRRSGTRYVAGVKTNSKKTRLVAFEFSVTQAYILEFGDQYIRFYRNNGQIQTAGSPYEVSSPYLEADLFQLRFTQNADTLFITHPSYEPRTLSRTGHTSWTLSTITFLDGPYLPLNTTATTLTPSAATGSGVTLTASAVTGINNDTGFKSTDVGRQIRIREGSTWGYVTITGFTSTTVVTVTVNQTLTNTSAKSFWRLGVWSTTTGFPAVSTFHEDRLGFAGNTNTPQRIDLSNTGDYYNFAPSALDGTVVATNALSFTFNASDVNVVRWIVSDEKGLLAGTVGNAWLVRPSSQGEALSPTNITAKPSTAFGSANVQALKIGSPVLFVQRAGRKIRELQYFFDSDGFRATDVTLLAEHVTQSGIVEMTWQKEPQPILWCVRADGTLLGMTYERDVDTFKVGWHRHILGGRSNAADAQAVVESVAVIPSSDESRYELWAVVKRYINGATVRYVEYMEKVFDDSVEQKDAFFLDSGLTYDVPLTITNVTSSTHATVTTSGSHSFSLGDKVLVSKVLGMSELNGESFQVGSTTTFTFLLNSLSGSPVNTSSYTAYVASGEVRKYVTTISGLDHLNGETVDILADGAVLPSKVVSSGTIALTSSATTVHAGLGYESDGKMLRLNAGAADGTAIGKTQRTHRIGVMLHRSLGFKIGTSFDSLETLTFRTTADELTRAPALFTGIKSETLEADYDFENQFCFRQDQPLPCMLLAIMPQMHTQDR